MKEIKFEILCPKCGHNKYQSEEKKENLEQDSFVKCESCGFEIMLGDLREPFLEEAKTRAVSEVKKEFEKMFKKWK